MPSVAQGDTAGAMLLLLLQSLSLSVPSYVSSPSFEWCVEKGADREAESNLPVPQVAQRVMEGCRLEWTELRSLANRTLPLMASSQDTDRALKDYEGKVWKQVRLRVIEARAKTTPQGTPPVTAGGRKGRGGH